MKKLLFVSMVMVGVNGYIQAGESNSWSPEQCRTQCTLPMTCTGAQVDECKKHRCQIGYWCNKTGSVAGKSSLGPQAPTRPAYPPPILALPDVPPSQESASQAETTPRAAGQREPSQRMLQKKDSKVIASSGTYTIQEMEQFIKGLLEMNYREVTTGCNTAIVQVKQGIDNIKEQTPQADDLKRRGEGYIELFQREMGDAKKEKDRFSLVQKDSVEKLQKDYPTYAAKSLLAAQDCKVKHQQFQGWLNDYYTKLNSSTVGPAKNAPENKPSVYERFKAKMPFSTKQSG